MGERLKSKIINMDIFAMFVKVSFQLTVILLAVLFFRNNQVHASEPLTDFSKEYQSYVHLLGKNPNKLVVLLNEQLKKPTSQVRRIQQHLLISLTYNEQVFPHEALKHAELGLALAAQAGQQWLINYLKVSKAISYDLLADPNSAIHLASQALEWAENNQYLRLTIQALLSRGLAYSNLRDSVNALKDTQKAYSLAPITDPLVAKALVAGYLALVYEYRRENKRAIPYFEEAAKYHRQHERWRDLGDVTYGLGRANLNIGNLKLGKKQLEESIELARRVDDFQGVAYGLKELAGLEFQAKNIDKAESMFKEALTIFEKSKNVYTISDILIWLARINIKNNKLKAAINYLDNAETYINKDVMSDRYFKLKVTRAHVFEKLGDYKKAYRLLNKNYPERLATLRKQYTQQFEQLKGDFELEKLDAKNRMLEKENLIKTSTLDSQIQKNQHLYFFAYLILVICILLLLISFKARQSKLRFERLSLIDELTQLSNRRDVMQMLERQIDLTHRHQEELTLAVIDLDFFKKINDSFGHATGDKVLTAFADLCRTMLRKTDIVGRIGGEEFLLALPKTNIQDALALLNKLREATLLIASNKNFKKVFDRAEPLISISIGVAELYLQENKDNLFSRADKALYSAKENGRNQIQIAK